MRLADYDFPLPPELIAQSPAPDRDAARMLVLARGSDQLEHSTVADLPAFLRPGDLVIVNDTRVIPARTFGRTAGNAAVELLWIRAEAPGHWLCLGKPAKRLSPGTVIDCEGGVRAGVAQRLGGGRYCLRVDEGLDVTAWLAEHGELPLPPYIKRPDGPLPLDRERYQTMFAAVSGAIAAPTAGLHFTPALVAAAQERGARFATLTLHVGPGTFRPVRCEDVRRHVMEAEWSTIPPATVAAIAATRAAGGRVIAVGTTTTRALESAVVDGTVAPGGRWADRFIVPGHRFRVVDALLTNFHLPGSTLLLLVSAFVGYESLMHAYAEAIRRRYRFYSYGDAMFVQ
ncbi:tRNA preQ1(34) S-adenosylmethionine ribosyltransferase-isomerase QueA [Candidatus Binatia bacterium]|nr:tRNA preQ1(34) S-adenosylmethionine ribosyltransferase-isomerase QueA [Candidatus Binatia bacterium]